MKFNYLIIIGLCFFVINGCGVKKVSINTFPPGGSVLLSDSGIAVKDGETAELKTGNYKLTVQNDFHEDRLAKIYVSRSDEQAFTLQCGKLIYIPVKINTVPEGGSIINLTTNESIKDGGVLRLKPGTYSFLVKNENHEDKTSQITINDEHDTHKTLLCGNSIKVPVILKTIPEGGTISLETNPYFKISDGEKVLIKKGINNFIIQKNFHKTVSITRNIVDKDKNTVIRLNCGQGYAKVNIKTEPENATIYIDDNAVGTGNLNLPLFEGKHKLKAEMIGFISYEDIFNVEPGKNFTKEIKLEKALSKVIIKTKPQKVDLYLNGNKIQERVLNLSYGKHKIYAVKYINKKERVTASEKVIISAPEKKEIFLNLNNKEILFENKWLPQKKAAELEQLKFEKNRVKNPFNFQININNDSFDNKTDLEKIYGLLRIGDLITIKNNNNKWTLQKRQSTITEKFISQWQTYLDKKKQEKLTINYKNKIIETDFSNSILETISSAVAYAHSKTVLVDLEKKHLSFKEIKINRTKSDGNIYLFFKGKININPEGETILKGSSFCLKKYSSNNSTINISWENPPDKIYAGAVLSDPFPKLSDISHLNIMEKKNLRIVPENIKIKEIYKFSGEEKDSVFKTEIINPDKKIASFLDFSIDEAGPHNRPGEFERIWIVKYLNKNNELTQKQISIAYKVSSQETRTESNILLRH